MLIMEWTLQFDPFDVMEEVQAAGVAAYPTLMNREVLESPQLAVRDFWVEHEHPEVGVRRHAGSPYHFSATPAEVWRAALTLFLSRRFPLIAKKSLRLCATARPPAV